MDGWVTYTHVTVLYTDVHKFSKNTGATSKLFAQIYETLQLGLPSTSNL
jgi:hypothetical protein